MQILAFISSLLGIFSKLTDIYRNWKLRKAGRREAELEQIREKVKILEKQRDVANRPPDSPDDILERMRRNQL